MRLAEIVSGGPIDDINCIDRNIQELLKCFSGSWNILRTQKYNFNFLSKLEQLADPRTRSLADPFPFISGKIPITVCPLFVSEFICDRADTVYDTQIMVYKSRFFQLVKFL